MRLKECALPVSESDQVEFKNSFNDEVIVSLVAFAKTKGGNVYIGINDSGSVHGLDIGKETIQNWINEVKNKTQPSIIPDAESTRIDGKSIVRLSINEFPVKPVAFKGRFFKRIKNSNHLMSAIEISDLNLQSLQLSWDSYPTYNKSFNDLDLFKIDKFIEKVNNTGRFSLHGVTKDNLEKIKLINGDTITNAALLLFSKETVGYNVHIGRFKTTSLIIDDKMLNGTLFETVEETMRFIIAQIKVAFEIKGMPTSRTEIFEYPVPALREMVLNSLIHRDYMSPVDVQIKIYDNKITFFNPGCLYGNLTIEDLKKDYYQAYTRNKLIAEAFYLTGDVEKYGSGFIRIRDEIKLYPTMRFDFKEIPNGFLVELNYKKQKISSEGINEGINEGLQTLFIVIRENPGIQTKNISVLLNNRPLKTLERQLSQLIKNQRIIRKGSNKSGGYWCC